MKIPVLLATRLDALTDFMDSSVASKADIAALRGDMKGDISDLKGELKADIADLRGEIKVIKWIGRVLIAGVLSLVMKAFFL